MSDKTNTIKNQDSQSEFNNSLNKIDEILKCQPSQNTEDQIKFNESLNKINEHTSNAQLTENSVQNQSQGTELESNKIGKKVGIAGVILVSLSSLMGGINIKSTLQGVEAFLDTTEIISSYVEYYSPSEQYSTAADIYAMDENDLADAYTVVEEEEEKKREEEREALEEDEKKKIEGNNRNIEQQQQKEIEEKNEKIYRATEEGCIKIDEAKHKYEQGMERVNAEYQNYKLSFEEAENKINQLEEEYNKSIKQAEEEYNKAIEKIEGEYKRIEEENQKEQEQQQKEVEEKDKAVEKAEEENKNTEEQQINQQQNNNDMSMNQN